MDHWAWPLVGISWAIWAALWLVMAFFVKRTAERPTGAWNFATGLVVIFSFVLLRGPFGRSSHHRVETSDGVQCAVVVLMVVGLAICFWARITLGRNWSGMVVFKEGHELIQTGPYRFVRHPIYTGMFAMVIGTAVEFNAPIAYGAAVVLITVLTLKSKQEEKLMVEHFPEQYTAYRAHTKAIIPFVV
jgi:protein-S-isoprenylcysteine O-methyltransferase Ste14